MVKQCSFSSLEAEISSVLEVGKEATVSISEGLNNQLKLSNVQWLAEQKQQHLITAMEIMNFSEGGTSDRELNQKWAGLKGVSIRDVQCLTATKSIVKQVMERVSDYTIPRLAEIQCEFEYQQEKFHKDLDSRERTKLKLKLILEKEYKKKKRTLFDEASGQNQSDLEAIKEKIERIKQEEGLIEKQWRTSLLDGARQYLKKDDWTLERVNEWLQTSERSREELMERLAELNKKTKNEQQRMCDIKKDLAAATTMVTVDAELQLKYLTEEAAEAERAYESNLHVLAHNSHRCILDTMSYFVSREQEIICHSLNSSRSISEFFNLVSDSSEYRHLNSEDVSDTSTLNQERKENNEHGLENDD